MLPACQITEALDALVGGDDVDPVPRLQPADEREHLVRGEVKGVQHETEFLVPNQREEAEGAVGGPLDLDALGAPRHGRLGVAGPLAQCLELVAMSCENLTVSGHGAGNRLCGVMKEVDVARESRGRGERVERSATREVTLPRLDAAGGQEPDYCPLECRESH